MNPGLKIALLSGLVTAIATSVAWGGTYNFYFNNTEQGDNSTAAPAVTVHGAKATGTNNAPEGEATSSNSLQPQTPAAPATQSQPQSISPPPAGNPVAPGNSVLNSSDTTLSESRARSYRPLRIAFGAGPFLGGPSFPGGTPMAALGLDVGLRFNQDVGINAWMIETGMDSRAFGYSKEGFGAELELVPIHITFGILRDLIDAGVMIGGSTLAAAPGNFASAHVGARVDLNLGDHWSISAVGRGNMGYLTAQAQLALRF